VTLEVHPHPLVHGLCPYEEAEAWQCNGCASIKPLDLKA
jgi:hypothetical protein